MADKHIVFGAPMIRRLFAGDKTQTRRILKAPSWSTGEMEAQGDHVEAIAKISGCFGDVPHIYRPDDKIWIKENCRAMVDNDDCSCVQYLADGQITKIENTQQATDLWLDLYDFGSSKSGKRGANVPSRFMPKWASRASLSVTSVKYENLQDITDEDALAEGVVPHPSGHGFWVPGIDHPDPNFPYLSRPTPRDMFAALWSVIHGQDSWNSNPIVAVPTFTFHPVNILKL